MWIFSKCGLVQTLQYGDLWPRYVVSINIACFDLCCKGLREKEAKKCDMHNCCNATKEMPLLHSQLRAGSWRAGTPQDVGVCTIFFDKLKITAKNWFGIVSEWPDRKSVV